MSFAEQLALAGAEHVDPDCVETYDRKGAFDPLGDIAMLREGASGVLLLRDIVFAFDSGEAEARIGAWLDTAEERAEDGWTREELETHVRHEQSTFSWPLEPMIERAGLDIDRADRDSLGIYARYLCTRRSC
jgi:hypothetical protein